MSFAGAYEIPMSKIHLALVGVNTSKLPEGIPLKKKPRNYFGFSTSILLTVAVLLELTLSALSIPFVFGLFNDIVLFCNLSNGSIAAAFHYMLTTLINYFS